MKKFAPLLLIALTYVLYAQDFEPKQQKIKTLGDTLFVNPDDSLFKLKNFMLGVQWGSTRKISTALSIKQMDGRRPEDPYDVPDSCDMFLPLDGQSHNMGEDLYNARAVQNKSSFICLLTYNIKSIKSFNP